MSRSPRAIGIAILGLVIVAAPSRAQTAPDKRAAFEVASVRLLEPTPPIRMVTDNRVVLLQPLSALVLIAFNIETYRLVLPDWVRQQRMWVEIRATLPTGASPQQVPQMLQTLLTERFGLVTHFEPRPIDVSELTVAPTGAKVQQVAAADDRETPYAVAKGGPDSPPYDNITSGTRTIVTPNGVRIVTGETNYEMKSSNGRGTTTYDATRVRMADLASMISASIGKPVIDKTGLTGLYRFRIELPNRPVNAAAMVEAMQRAGVTTNRSGEPITVRTPDDVPPSGSATRAVEALGLRLQDRRAPFDVLVVDKLEKVPTPN